LLKYYTDNYSFIKDKNKEGRFNTVMFFIEHSLKLLKPDGYLGFIVDTNIHSNPYHDLREYILENYSIKRVVDEISVFDGVASSQMIMAVKKTEDGTNDVVYENLASAENRSYKQTALLENNYSLKEPKNQLISDLLAKIERHPSIADLIGNKNIRTCITFTGKKEYFVKKTKDTELDYPLLEGSSGVSGPYAPIKYTNYVAYDLNLRDKLNEEYRELAVKENKRSPKVIGLGDLNRFKAPKIFIRLSDSRITGTYTEEVVCADLSLYILTLPNLETENETFYLKYLLAVINSSIVSYYFINKNYIRNLGTGTPQIRLKDLRSMPIPVTGKQSQKTLSDKVEKIIGLNESLWSISSRFQKLLTTELSMKKQQLASTWWKLSFDEFIKDIKTEMTLQKKDELLKLFEKYQNESSKYAKEVERLKIEMDQEVCRLYELTDNEIKIVEKKYD